MASVECGHVYVVFTTLTKPEPKEKIVLCICEKKSFSFGSTRNHSGTVSAS